MKSTIDRKTGDTIQVKVKDNAATDMRKGMVRSRLGVCAGCGYVSGTRSREIIPIRDSLLCFFVENRGFFTSES